MKQSKTLSVVITAFLIVISGTITYNIGYNKADELAANDLSEMQLMYLELEAQYSQLSNSNPDRFEETEYAPPSISLLGENPIDIFFDEWGTELSGVTIEINTFSANYAMSWKEEMLHAYEVLLANANPHSEELQNYITASRELFLDFVENDAYLEGLVHWSDGFWYMKADVGDTQEVRNGSGFSSGKSAAAASLYKQQTLRLYDMLDAIDVEIDFVFDADKLTDIKKDNN